MDLPRQQPEADGLELTRVVADILRVTGEEISEDELRHLMTDTPDAHTLTNAAFAEALSWATQVEVADGAPLLGRSAQHGRATMLHPHQAAVEARTDIPVHPTVIAFLVNKMRTAMQTSDENLMTTALNRLRRAAETHPSAAAAAAILGFPLMSRGEPAGGVFTVIVMEHGPPDLAAMATRHLTHYFQTAGEWETAALFWEHATDLDLLEHLPEAPLALAYCLHRLVQRRVNYSDVVRCCYAVACVVGQ